VNNYKQWQHFQNVAGAVRRLGAARSTCAWSARLVRRLLGVQAQALDLAAGSLLVEEAGGA